MNYQQTKLNPKQFQAARAFTGQFVSFKSAPNRFQTYSQAAAGLAKSVWNRSETFCLRTHECTSICNRFQNDSKVSCEMG